LEQQRLDGACRPALHVRQGRLSLDFATASDVGHIDSPVCKYPADQEVTMASRRVFLTAQHRYPELGGTTKKPLDTPCKLLRTSHSIIQNIVRLVVELIAIRAATEFPAKKNVLDAIAGE
jgi:hypothetical protein